MLFIMALFVIGIFVPDHGLVAQRGVATARTERNDAQSVDELLARRISLTVTNVSLRRALDSIAHVAKVIVQYREPMLDVYPAPVSVQVVDVPLGIVFERLFDKTKLRVASDGQGDLAVVVAARGGADSVPMVGTVVGRVVDSATGRGLSGTRVKVVGTKISVVTNDSGRFTVPTVPVGDQELSARVFGYHPTLHAVTVKAGEQTSARILMVSAPTILSDVVTTAAGTQKKIEVGNDITTLNVDSIRQIAPIMSVTDLLETRVPGLTILHSSGTPGDPSRLRVRGASSIGLNNDPIVVVDGIRVYASQSDLRNNNLATSSLSTTNEPNIGIGASGGGQSYSAPSPLDQIDPSSIATIEVLKGPSATAIYGSDAANGVIVITTKHGRAGPTHWSLDLGDGVNWSPGSWPVNYYRFGYDGTGISGISSGFCPWYNTLCTVDSVVPFQALNDPRYTVFSHGTDQQASLSISGGTPTLTYNLTGSGSADVGLLKLPSSEEQRYNALYGSRYGDIPHYLVRPDNYTTWGGNGSLTVIPTPTLQLTLQSSLFASNQQQGSLSGAITQLANEYITPELLNQTAGQLIQGEVERATDHATTENNSLALSWRLRPWLPLSMTGGLNTIHRTDVAYVPFGLSTAESFGDVSAGGDTTGHYNVGYGTSQNQTITVGTTIPLRLVTLALGGNLNSQYTADVRTGSELAPGVTVPTTSICANAIPCASSLSSANQSTYGWYVEPRLNLASRFFATPGFRLDGGSGGSTSSGSIAGLSAFPKIDLSYVAVDRQGNDPLWGILTLLRPRLALGIAGNQPPLQSRLRLFNGNGLPELQAGSNPVGGVNENCQPLLTLDGMTSVPAVCLMTLGNTNLRPERTREIEGGVDATLWQGRLSLTYTRYNKTTQDAIVPIPVAPSAGALIDEVSKNIGIVRNTGTELTLNASILRRRIISWDVGMNLSNNNSLVVQLNPNQQPICLGYTLTDDIHNDKSGNTAIASRCTGSRIVPGYPIFGEWALPIASFADANHDGIIEAEEIRYGDSTIYVGQPNPEYQANYFSTLTLFNGRLSATANFAYVNGLTQNGNPACNASGLKLLPNSLNTPLATQAAVVAAGCVNDQLNGNVAPLVTPIGLYQTVSTLRFQSLSINYAVPRVVSDWFRVPRMALALQGNNIGLHTSYRGKDPDVNAFSTVSAGDETIDLGQIPEPRTWWIKMSLGN